MRTERTILDTTLRLLASHGIHGTSLDLVAETAGVAKSSILWHFGSKEELLLRAAEHVVNEVARGPAKTILELPTLAQRENATWRFFADTLRERTPLRRLVLWLIFECTDERPELRARIQQLYRTIRELFEAGLREVVTDRAQRRRLAIFTVATFDGIFLQWLLEPEAIDIDALHRDLRAWNERALPVRRRKDR